MTKHQQYYQSMLTREKELFARFRLVHDEYVLNPKSRRSEFDTIGREVLDTITEYENRLCHQSEKGQYAAYSKNLADKFWLLVRQDFSHIDDVGVEVSYVTPSPTPPPPPPTPPNLRRQSSDDIFNSMLDNVLDNLTKTRV